MHVKPYKKDFDYSYTRGVFLTIELMNHRPDRVIKIYLSSNADKNSGVTKIKDLANKQNIPVEVNDKAVSRLSPKENCYAVGIFSKYETPLAKDKNHIVLVNPMDSGNLGTILRTSLGFGITDIAIIRPAVDIFDPKTVRASMGALFSVSFAYYNEFNAYRSLSSGHALYPFMLHAKKSLHDVDSFIKKPYSLIFGNESSGLPDEFREIGTGIVIPHSKNIDSLNLSVSVGIACYAFAGK